MDYPNSNHEKQVDYLSALNAQVEIIQPFAHPFNKDNITAQETLYIGNLLYNIHLKTENIKTFGHIPSEEEIDFELKRVVELNNKFNKKEENQNNVINVNFGVKQ